MIRIVDQSLRCRCVVHLPQTSLDLRGGLVLVTAMHPWLLVICVTLWSTCQAINGAVDHNVPCQVYPYGQLSVILPALLNIQPTRDTWTADFRFTGQESNFYFCVRLKVTRNGAHITTFPTSCGHDASSSTPWHTDAFGTTFPTDVYIDSHNKVISFSLKGHEMPFTVETQVELPDVVTVSVITYKNAELNITINCPQNCLTSTFQSSEDQLFKSLASSSNFFVKPLGKFLTLKMNIRKETCLKQSEYQNMDLLISGPDTWTRLDVLYVGATGLDVWIRGERVYNISSSYQCPRIKDAKLIFKGNMLWTSDCDPRALVVPHKTAEPTRMTTPTTLSLVTSVDDVTDSTSVQEQQVNTETSTPARMTTSTKYQSTTGSLNISVLWGILILMLLAVVGSIVDLLLMVTLFFPGLRAHFS